MLWIYKSAQWAEFNSIRPLSALVALDAPVFLYSFEFGFPFSIVFAVFECLSRAFTLNSKLSSSAPYQTASPVNGPLPLDSTGFTAGSGLLARRTSFIEFNKRISAKPPDILPHRPHLQHRMLLWKLLDPIKEPFHSKKWICLRFQKTTCNKRVKFLLTFQEMFEDP